MFDTPQFWAAVLVAAASWYVVPGAWLRARLALLVAFNLLVLYGVFGLPPLALGMLLGSTAWIIAGMRLSRRLAGARPFLATTLVVAPALAIWVLGKQAVALGWGPLEFLSFVGLSFYLIKAWTLVKDVHDGRLKDPDAPTILAYFTFFPTYVAGPMHYYREFAAGAARPSPPDATGLLDILFRALLGLVKVKVLAPLLVPMSLVALQREGDLNPRNLAIGSVVYSLVIWLDFSGYSDLAISVSRFLGLAAPENFNNPYLAPNIRDFWQRWHMSFSRVLTSYVFIPLSRALQGRLGDRPQTIRTLSYLGTFAFCGYWHGPTPNFLVWGLYHGVGLTGYDLYRTRLTRAKLRAGIRPVPAAQQGVAARLAGALARGLATAATFVFVSIGWIPFVLPLSRLAGK